MKVYVLIVINMAKLLHHQENKCVLYLSWLKTSLSSFIIPYHTRASNVLHTYHTVRLLEWTRVLVFLKFLLHDKNAFSSFDCHQFSTERANF